MAKVANNAFINKEKNKNDMRCLVKIKEKQPNRTCYIVRFG